MNLKNRIEKLESEMEPHDKETIVYIQDYSGSVKQIPGKKPQEPVREIPDPKKEIARQRAEGKRLIVVSVPHDGHI
jgi:hypothetical protein